MTMDFKFFPRDVISGEARKVGDRFMAVIFGSETAFVVTEHNGTFFFAEMV